MPDQPKSVKEISDKELKEGFQEVLKAFVPISAKLTGEKMRTTITNKEVESIRNVLEFFQGYSDKTDALKKQTLPKDFKKEQEMSLLDQMMGEIFDDANAVENLAEQYNPKLAYEKIIPDEKYRERIRGAIWQILIEIDKNKKLSQFTDFIQSMGLDMFYSNSQSAQRVQELLPYIMKPRKRISRRIAENYIEAYKEISAFLEPLIVILYGCDQILKGNYLTFVQIKKKKSIGEITTELKNEQLFNTILEPYDPKIRNAIVHGTYHLDPLEKIIELIDIEQKITKSFVEFSEYVKEITRRAIILCRIEQELQFLQFRAYAELRKNRKYPQKGTD